jgi:hypothetical protein
VILFVMLFSIVYVSATKTNDFVVRNRNVHSTDHRLHALSRIIQYSLAAHKN